jgi:hypothetical protein
MRIGGVLDYQTLARWHRPTDAEVLAREARELARLGFTVSDVASALELAEAEAAGLLADRQAA